MIRRTFQTFIRWAMSYDNPKDRVELCEPVSTNRLNGSGLNFTIFSASGGHVVEYRSYDTKSDERINNLHIITSDQDIGERIGQIVTMELLRKN
jgi:hypothetical protein